jgi:hypothetical protein
MALRVDRNSNAVCQTNCFSNLATPFNVGTTFNPSLAYNQLIVAGQHSAFPDLEKVVLQPRFGFAYSPKGSTSTVLRGGVGLFSDLYPGTIVDNFNRNTPSSTQFALFGLPFAPSEPGSAEGTVTGCNTSFISNFFGGGNLNSFLGSAPAGCAPPTFNSVVGKVQNPKYLEWNLEIQQALGNKTSFSVNYVGNHGYDLFVLNPAVNSYSTAAIPIGGLPSAAPSPSFGRASLLTNDGVSNYHGLTTSVNRRFTLGFTGSVNYTWSHAQDEVSNGGFIPYSLNDSLLAQINPYCLRCLNYSNADYDVRHNLTANYVWDLPFKAHSSFVNRVISSWTLSGTFFWHTGYPFTVFDGQAPLTGSVVHNGSADIILGTFLGGQVFPCTSPTNNCINASQFAPVTSETTFGNIPRNFFRGPSYFNSDFSILKNIPITERFRFGIGATAYNIFNHPNFANPPGDISSGQFGQITTTVVPPTSPYGSFVGSAVSGRILQVQGRLTF